MEKYSVLMPVCCRENADHFRAAIQSMLRQTVPPDDFVLVCDGALPPDLDAVVNEHQNQYGDLFQTVRLPEKRGLGSALHIGLLSCRYELIARMDSDDIAVPDRIRWELKTLEAHPKASVVGGQILEFSGAKDNITGERTVPLTPEGIRRRAAFRNPVNHVTVVFRRSHVLRAGSYQNLPGFEDYDLWVRLITAGCQIYNIDRVCCYVRVGAEMYQRRGGRDYFRNTLNFEKKMLSMGMQSSFQFYGNVCIRFVGAVIVPGCARGILYNSFLRTHRASVLNVD